MEAESRTKTGDGLRQKVKVPLQRPSLETAGANNFIPTNFGNNVFPL